MSDLFKKNAPRLSEDEERRLWQRVRAIPDEVQAERASERAADAARGESRGSRPWWQRLFSAPAFRYGAPALAVLLAATLFVLRQNPHAPAPGREMVATRAAEPEAQKNAPSEETVRDQEHDRRTPASPGVAVESVPAPTADAPAPTAVLEKKQKADRDAGNFAPEPPGTNERQKSAVVFREVAPLAAGNAAPPAPEPSAKVTVIKGGKSTASEPPAPAPAPAQTNESGAKDELRVESKDVTSQSETSQLVESDTAEAPEGAAAGAPAAGALDVKGGRSLMFRADGGTSAWQQIVAGADLRGRIEVVPSIFGDGGVVVLAGATEAGLGLLVDAAIAAQSASRATPLARDPSSGRWGAAAWVYDRKPDALSPILLRPEADKTAPVRGMTITRRETFRDAPDDVQIAYLAAEGERASAISASSTSRARFDRLLVEANRVAARHPTDARVVRLVQLLTSTRATVR